MDTSDARPELDESRRRVTGASGIPVRLSNGQDWLLASPTFQPTCAGLTLPLIDRSLDRLFDGLALAEGVELRDVWDVAASLLRANYELTDAEAAELLSIAQGEGGLALTNAVLDAVFGDEKVRRTFSAWVRASLIANGLAPAVVPAVDLPNVLAILLATNRTIPIGQFADASREAAEKSALESLV